MSKYSYILLSCHKEHPQALSELAGVVRLKSGSREAYPVATAPVLTRSPP